jgi:hypothetical protein
LEKIITIYGECEEDEDPQLIVKAIMDGFDRLNKTGYRDLAVSTLDEAALALRLSGILQGRKSAYRAKQDGDWDELKAGIENCKTDTELMQWKVDNRSRIAAIPADWIEHLNEIFNQQKEAVK